MNKIISLSDTTALVDAVVDAVFMERDGKIDYFPEYLEVAKAYYKVFFYYPEMIEGETIFDFYIKYINGEYNDALNNYVDIKQSQYIDDAIDRKIVFRQNQVVNPLAYSLSNVLDNIAALTEIQKTNFEDVDMKKLVDGISSFGENFDTEKAIKLLTENKPSVKKSSQRKTKAKTEKTGE